MKAVRAMLLVGVLSAAAGSAWAVGSPAIGTTFDTLITSLGDAKADIEKASQLKSVDKAIVALQASSATQVTANATSLKTAITKLGKVAKAEAIAPNLNTAVSALYIPIVGRMGAAVFQQGTWLQTHPGIKNAAKAAGRVIAMGKARKKLDDAQNSTTKTAAQKMAVFVASAKTFESAFKFYGGKYE